jgi:adenosylcobinamide kinase/adenosylcobinamide-phosphate guanylyltransferase
LSNHVTFEESFANSERFQKSPLDNLALITGGARSGKSLFAEQLAVQSGAKVVYVATMPHLIDDAELSYKVEQHRRRRPDSWSTIEAEFDVQDHFPHFPPGPGICVIDCLSLYVSNLMLDHIEGVGEPVSPDVLRKLDYRVSDAMSKLVSGICARPDWSFVVVTNEVGWSVVPDNKMARIYKDLLGNANQTLATCAATVYLTCVGIRIKLKENGTCKLE